MKTYFSKLHYSKTQGLRDIFALIFLAPASFCYFLIVSIRNFLYNTGLMKSEKLAAFVISIGNLTTGGTGKTPVTSAIANHFIGLNKKVAVISRGYGGKLSSKNTNIISDGENTFFTADMAGDEPFWIAENSKGTVVITGKDRATSGKLAVEKFGCEVLLLDDGFQHRRVQRDLDIVLVDCVNKFGNGFLLPAGPLRESLNGIKRADKIVVVNKNSFTEKAEHLQKLFAQKYGKNTSICEFIAGEIYDIQTNQPVNEIKTAFVFSGIAQPESFFKLIEQKGINQVVQKTYNDHYLYTQNDIELIVADSVIKGIDAIITTEKDAVKIKPFLDKMKIQIPVCALKLKTSITLDNLIEK